MEFGREAVAEHLAKNKIPKLENLKLDLSGAIDGMKDFGIKLDEIAKDIQKRKDNAMAMEFTKCIGELLKKNGVVPKMTEYTRNFETDNTFEARYGVSIDELDFSEHDKVFKDEISKLEEELSRATKEIRQEKHKRELTEWERQELKQRIAELESEKTDLKHGLNRMAKTKSHWIDRAVEWQKKCEKLESEKSEKPVAYVLAKEIDGQHYVTVEDFMSVVNNLQ